MVTLNACFNEFSPLVVARFGPAVRRNVFLTKLLLEEKATIPGTNQKLLHSCPIVATARLRLELFIGENLCFERVSEVLPILVRETTDRGSGNMWINNDA